MTDKCDAAIRTFRPASETELRCKLEVDGHSDHQAILKDYAWPGSSTVVHWQEGDRRNFHGEWPGECPEDCILPLNHPGNHAP